MHQLATLPRQLTQLPLWLRRHQAATQQAALQQLRDPLAVLDIGLASRHVLDVLGVDQEDLEAVLQQVPDRLPVNPGRFHSDMAHPFGLQPVGQFQQLLGHGAVGTGVLMHLAFVEAAHRGDDGLFVNIKSSTAGIEDVHGFSPGNAPPEDSDGSSNLLCVLAWATRQQSRVRSAVRVRLTRGLVAPSKFRPGPEKRRPSE